MEKIKLTVQELVNIVDSGAIRRFLNVPKPVGVSWKNRKLGLDVDSEMVAYNKKRIELLENSGAKLPAGAREYVFEGDSLEKFKNGLKELLSQTVDLSGEPVEISELQGSLSEADLFLLEKFIKDSKSPPV